MSSSSAHIPTYIPIPHTLTVPTNSLKSVIDGTVAKYGVRWVIKTRREAKDRETDTHAEDGEKPKRKKRSVDYKFVAYYVCHRGRKYKHTQQENSEETSHRSEDINGREINRRPRQKKSKKIGCQATLKVTCYKKDSSNVAIVHKGPHSHEVGSIDDIQYLPRTSPSRKVIEESCMDKERGTGISDTEDSTDTVPTTTPIEETGFNDALENIERLKCALDKYRHEPHILSEERISLLHDNMLEIERLLSPFQLEDIGSNH